MHQHLRIQRSPKSGSGACSISLDEWRTAIGKFNHLRLTFSEPTTTNRTRPRRLGSWDTEVFDGRAWRPIFYWNECSNGSGMAGIRPDAVRNWHPQDPVFQTAVDLCRELGAHLVTDDQRVLDPITLQYQRPPWSPNQKDYRCGLVEAIHHLTLHLTLDGFDTEAEQIRRIVAALASEKDIAQAVRPMIHNLSTMPLTEDTRQALTDTMTEALRLNPGGAGNRVNLDKNPLA